MSTIQPIGPSTPAWDKPNALDGALVETWIKDGFVILSGLFNGDQIARYNAIVAGVRASVDDGKDASGYGGRIGQLHQKHPDLLEMPSHPQLLGFLDWAFGDEPVVMGSLNFECGTQQDAHIDAIYFYPDPIWTMAGVWIALEDIHPEAGPLFYIPGSHRMPFSHSNDVVAVRPDLAARREAVRRGELDKKGAVLADMEKGWYEDLAALHVVRGAHPTAPLLKAGDAVIWHSLLAHGGSRRIDPALSRRSAVFHYFGKTSRLLTYEQFMLHSQEELREQAPTVRPLRRYGSLQYHHAGHFVTYGAAGEEVHVVAEPTGFADNNATTALPKPLPDTLAPKARPGLLRGLRRILGRQ